MQRTSFDIVVSIAALGLLGFMGWHGIYGEQSRARMHQIRAERVAIEARLAQIRARRVRLEGHIALLRPASVDPDMADEMIRRYLGFAKKGELVLSLQ